MSRSIPGTGTAKKSSTITTLSGPLRFLTTSFAKGPVAMKPPEFMWNGFVPPINGAAGGGSQGGPRDIPGLTTGQGLAQGDIDGAGHSK